MKAKRIGRILLNHNSGTTALESVVNYEGALREIGELSKEDIKKDPFIKKVPARYIYNMIIWSRYLKKYPEEHISDIFREKLEREFGNFDEDPLTILSADFINMISQSWAMIGKFEFDEMCKGVDKKDVKKHFIEKAFQYPI